MAAVSAFGQPAFEVASIKASPPQVMGVPMRTGVRGGPGSSDPGLVTMENMDLFSLVAMAYGLQRHQLVAPDWLGSTRFSISARVPQGATVDQYRLMLQNLLAERFRLTVHRDRKEMAMYDLVVAKNGPKMKAAPVESGPPVPDGLQPPLPRAGPPPGYHGPANMTLPSVPMDRFAASLAGFLGVPILDRTGLAGNYEIRLRAMIGAQAAASDAADAPPEVFTAIQDQLGLRLVPRKDLVDVLVVDHIEKTPTDN